MTTYDQWKRLDEDPREGEYQSELESVYDDLRAAQAEIKDLKEYIARLKAMWEGEHES